MVKSETNVFQFLIAHALAVFEQHRPFAQYQIDDKIGNITYKSPTAVCFQNLPSEDLDGHRVSAYIKGIV